MISRYPVFVFEKSFYNKIILKVLEKLFNFFQSLFLGGLYCQSEEKEIGKIYCSLWSGKGYSSWRSLLLEFLASLGQSHILLVLYIGKTQIIKICLNFMDAFAIWQQQCDWSHFGDWAKSPFFAFSMLIYIQIINQNRKIFFQITYCIGT